MEVHSPEPMPDPLQDTPVATPLPPFTIPDPAPPVQPRLTEEESRSLLLRSLAATEHNTLKVPHEIMNRRFRTAQKGLEGEVKSLSATVADAQRTLAGPVSAGRVSSLLQGVLRSVRTLKRKASEAAASEVEMGRVVRRRIAHLHEADAPGEDRQAWEGQRLLRLTVDYLLREGCYGSARMIVEENKLGDTANYAMFSTAHEIELSLTRDHSISRCLAWSHENKSKLKKLSSYLDFNLRVQEFLELIKSGSNMDAVLHSRKYLAVEDPELLKLVQNCMALLAFPGDTKVAKYRYLLSAKRWHDLALQFREDHLKVLAVGSQPALASILQAGLSALKTPQCAGPQDKGKHNPDCPVCFPPLTALASDLPFAHASQSRLMCRMSGELLNENNQPMMLPNGKVYGTKALECMATTEGQITCPQTGLVCRLGECVKVFVM